MSKEQEHDVKFLPLMLTKPVVEVSSGAFSGKRYQAKRIEEIFDMTYQCSNSNSYTG